MIKAQFTLTKEEYIEAQSAYVAATQRNTIYGLAVMLAASFVLYFGMNPDKLNQRNFADVRMVPAATILLSPLWLPLLRRWGYKRRYRVERDGLTGLIVVLDDAGYTVTTAEQANGFVPWSAMFAFLETRNLILLLKGYTFRAIPKRALSVDDLSQARGLVTSHLPQFTRKLAKSQGR